MESLKIVLNTTPWDTFNKYNLTVSCGDSGFQKTLKKEEYKLLIKKLEKVLENEEKKIHNIRKG